MTFQERRDLYVAYLKMKTWEEDWHGVSDAANDLRELYAEHHKETGALHGGGGSWMAPPRSESPPAQGGGGISLCGQEGGKVGAP